MGKNNKKESIFYYIRLFLRAYIAVFCSANLILCAALKADTISAFGVPIHGFADAGYGFDNTTTQYRGYNRGFYLGNVDLYIDPDFGNRIRFLAELVAEPDFSTQEMGFDTERLMIGYVFSNYLSAWVGRFHTPIGYWPMAYHHGAELQTTIDRPRYLDFEDHFGVIPVHTVGLWLRGDAFVSGDNRIGYMGWIGNGDSLSADSTGFTSLSFNSFHDDNFDTTLGGRLIWFFGGNLSGLQLGVSGMRQRVNYVADSSVNANVGYNFGTILTMGSAHLVYENHGFEFINEVSIFDNKDANDSSLPSVTSYAGYSQLAYWFNNLFAPYGRFERGYFNQSDNYFAAQSNGLSYSKWTAGLRYNVAENAAVKIEYSNTQFSGASVTNPGENFETVRTNYAIRF